ncbi:MAG: TIGR02281 family clan AA aspartic protease [Gammaproteobacteria bacterium]|nr:TIGR02281 family clan AA aspartic protease [Gammaproteobacteria bacterium]MCI0591662.1 TIGR02281 family clan AA aspartic protease [Gammaproteobacteria bacterium]
MQKLLTQLLFLLLAAPVAYAVDKIVVLGLFKDKAVVEIDGKQRVLTVGKASPEGVKLISADSKAAVLEVDGQTASYTLGTHIGSTFAGPSPQAIVQIWPNDMGMYMVSGSINDLPISFLVDTGATNVAMNEHQAKRIGLDFKLEGTEGQAQTASGITRVYYVNLKRVKVGDIGMRDVQAAVLEGDYPTEVLLGMSFLSKVEMTRAGRLLELRKR